MVHFNSVVMIGNATRDAETRVFDNGTHMTRMRIAVNMPRGNGEEDTTFIGVTCFGKLAEIAGRCVKRGRSILVSGRLQQRNWKTDSGEDRHQHEILADKIIFLDQPPNAEHTEWKRPDGQDYTERQETAVEPEF